MKVFEIEAKKRENTGTKYAKLARKEDNVPAVVYGGEENLHIDISKNSVNGLIYTDLLSKAAITVDGKTVEALIKAVDFHPVTDEIRHVDFIQLTEGKSVKAQIPVHVEGTSEGVKMGGKQQVRMRKVNVTAAPEKLVEKVTIDTTEMQIGQSVRVRDLNIEGIEFTDSPANPIVSILMARGAKKAEAAE